MRTTTDALIIRENNNIGEADRFVTALTRDLGIVRASARGARNLKNRSASATQLLSYSRLTLYQGKAKYIIDEAEPLEVFFDLRSDIEKLALAQYFCELAGVLAPQEEPAGDFLRLMLNALHFLGNGRRPPLQIKAVVELRLLSMAGFMPDLTACRVCGSFDAYPVCFFPAEGSFICPTCLNGAAPSGALLLGGNVLAAMRHIIYAAFDKCFSFTMADDGLHALAAASETYLLAQLNRSFKTLDFYRSLS